MPAPCKRGHFLTKHQKEELAFQTLMLFWSTDVSSFWLGLGRHIRMTGGIKDAISIHKLSQRLVYGWKTVCHSFFHGNFGCILIEIMQCIVSCIYDIEPWKMVCDDVPNILSCFAFLPYFSCPSTKKNMFFGIPNGGFCAYRFPQKQALHKPTYWHCSAGLWPVQAVRRSHKTWEHHKCRL